MDLATIGWIALGWFGLSVILSVAIGGFIRTVNEAPSEGDLADAASKQKVLRYMRIGKPVKASGNTNTSRVKGSNKHAIR